VKETEAAAGGKKREEPSGKLGKGGKKGLGYERGGEGKSEFLVSKENGQRIGDKTRREEDGVGKKTY